MGAMSELAMELRRRGIRNPRAQQLYLDLKCFGKWQKAVRYVGTVRELQRVLRAATKDTRPLRVVPRDAA